MNCPSRTDNPDAREDWNQSPNLLSGTTREDFNGRTNSRVRRSIEPDEFIDGILPGDQGPETKDGRLKAEAEAEAAKEPLERVTPGTFGVEKDFMNPGDGGGLGSGGGKGRLAGLWGMGRGGNGAADGADPWGWMKEGAEKLKKILWTFTGFIGPGFMISVAYIDPGNYSTDVAAGASYQFKLLFVVLCSNIIAIYLQSLCIKLGTVSGMDLAQMSRAHLPWWLNIFLYILAEGAIIATDIAEVIGTAIAINLLIPQIPLVAGCAISIFDVLLILIFYRPNGTTKGLRAFEFFVMALVLGVVVCFCIQLSLIKGTSVGEVFRGYLPSKDIVEGNAIYQACGILGATVMPHSLYLGSGIVQPRLLEYDRANGHASPAPSPSAATDSYSTKPIYQPSLSAINFCLTYSTVELAISLFTFALFVNSAILIVAGASLYGVDGAEDASLFSIYDLLSHSIAPAAGTIFALALLLSGVSAGIVCTIAGQMVSEGALNWTIAPWLRRLITRSISIVPSIIIAAAIGKDGLTAALNGSQVALSVALPFLSAPLIYFTARNKFMTVPIGPQANPADEDESDDEADAAVETEHRENDSPASGRATAADTTTSTFPNSNSRLDPGAAAVEEGASQPEGVKMRNHWITTTFAVIVWIIITVMNVANLVLLGLGR